MKLEKVQVKTYTGSMESLEDLVKSLKLQAHEYRFDVLTKNVLIWRDGLVLQSGDCYHVRSMEPERFEAI